MTLLRPDDSGLHETSRGGSSSSRTTATTATATSTLPPPQAAAWVEPASLPHCEHPGGPIGGNAPEYVKRLLYNTFICYGVGEDPICFGMSVGKSVRFIEVNVSYKEGNSSRGAMRRMEAVTVAELVVTKAMLNGAGMLHGGCVAYLVDNCCSTPLVVLGLMNGGNGVGVTQAMNVQFHAPAPLGTCIHIISTSVSLGGRVMSARCELVDRQSGRMIASAFLNKMQPVMSKM